MESTKVKVSKIASLANLPLSKLEEKKYTKQLASILHYFEKVASIDTKNVEPTFNLTGLKNVTRDDKAQTQLSQKQALQNAAKREKGYFVTSSPNE